MLLIHYMYIILNTYFVLGGFLHTNKEVKQLQLVYITVTAAL